MRDGATAEANGQVEAGERVESDAGSRKGRRAGPFYGRPRLKLKVDEAEPSRGRRHGKSAARTDRRNDQRAATKPSVRVIRHTSTQWQVASAAARLNVRRAVSDLLPGIARLPSTHHVSHPKNNEG